MKQVNVHQAKTHLSRLLADVEAGEEVVIARGGKPVAKLIRIPNRKKRVFGKYRGEIEMSQFDAADADLRAMWEPALRKRGLIK